MSTRKKNKKNLNEVTSLTRLYQGEKESLEPGDKIGFGSSFRIVKDLLSGNIKNVRFYLIQELKKIAREHYNNILHNRNKKELDDLAEISFNNIVNILEDMAQKQTKTVKSSIEYNLRSIKSDIRKDLILNNLKQYYFNVESMAIMLLSIMNNVKSRTYASAIEYSKSNKHKIKSGLEHAIEIGKNLSFLTSPYKEKIAKLENKIVKDIF